jgi:hypothetical protein
METIVDGDATRSRSAKNHTWSKNRGQTIIVKAVIIVILHNRSIRDATISVTYTTCVHITMLVGVDGVVLLLILMLNAG